LLLLLLLLLLLQKAASSKHPSLRLIHHGVHHVEVPRHHLAVSAANGAPEAHSHSHSHSHSGEKGVGEGIVVEKPTAKHTSLSTGTLPLLTLTVPTMNIAQTPHLFREKSLKNRKGIVMKSKEISVEHVVEKVPPGKPRVPLPRRRVPVKCRAPSSASGISARLLVHLATQQLLVELPPLLLATQNLVGVPDSGEVLIRHFLLFFGCVRGEFVGVVTQRQFAVRGFDLDGGGVGRDA